MAATEYKPISWPVGSPTDVDKLGQMTQNDQYLFENMTTVTYNANGLKRAKGVKILAGRSATPASITDWVAINIAFGSYFTPGCYPVVNASFSNGSGASQRKFVTMMSLNGTENIDHRGFHATVSNYEWLFDGGKDRIIKHGGIVHWIAVGY